MENFIKNEMSRIASGTQFTGNFATRSDLRIDGVFEGKLYCAGRLVIGEKGVVKGTVIGNVIDFSGTMSGGTFFVKDTLSLKDGSSVDGDIFTRRLQVDLGARFVGTSKILDEDKYAKAAAPFESMLPDAGASAPAEPQLEAPAAEPATPAPAASDEEPVIEPAPAASTEDRAHVDSMSESWLGWSKKRSQ